MSAATPLPALDPRVTATFNEAGKVFRPPPKLKVSEWAERFRILSSESSREAGRYRLALAPFQREPQDALNIPGVEKITLMAAAQLLKSTVLENMFGYLCSEDPCPIIYVWPTKDIADEWSVDTLDPMIRDTPKLTKLFEHGDKKAANKKGYKGFPGGSLSVIGAKSAAQLRRRRARVIFFEEIDEYSSSVGSGEKTQGDPRMVLAERQKTFWDAITIEASTTTIEGMSNIAASYEASNQQKYWVPCPHCSESAEGGAVSPPITDRNKNAGIFLDGYQVLHWDLKDPEKDGQRGGMVLDKIAPHTGTAYECEHCGVLIDEIHKTWMNKHGEWRAKYPERTRHQGFHISSLYSPFPRASWARLAEQFLNAVEHRENPELLKVFVNLSLAETWKENEIEIDEDELLRRRESWSSLPDKITVLTAGVDVQEDRIEVVVKGWGKGQESWVVDFICIDGSTDEDATWKKLEDFLTNSRYLHARGVRLSIACAFIDSGFRAAKVFAFTASRWSRRICACRGQSGFNKAPVDPWNRKNKQKQKVFPVNVDVVKELVYGRLAIEVPGPGYIHLKKEIVDRDYVKQLKSERLKKKNEKGFPKRYWWKPDGARNEKLDIEVYATAAFLSLAKDIPAMLENVREQLIDDAKELAARKKEKLNPDQLALLDTNPMDKEQLTRDGVIEQDLRSSETASHDLVNAIDKAFQVAADREGEEQPAQPAEGEYRTQESEPEQEPEEEAPVRAKRNWATSF